MFNGWESLVNLGLEHNGHFDFISCCFDGLLLVRFGRSDSSECLSPSSDHGPSVRCDRQPRGPVGGPAERSLGGSARPQRLSVPGQIPDPLQTGGQPGLEGKGPEDMLEGHKSALWA